MESVSRKLSSENLPGMLLVLFCAILPWSLAGMQIAAGLVVVSSIVYHIRRKIFPITYHPFYIFLVIYLFSQLIAAFASPDYRISLPSFLDTDWFIFLFPFLISLPVNKKWRIIALRTLFASSALVAIYGIIQFFIGVDIFHGKVLNPMGHFYRAEGTYNFYLTFAGNQTMILSLVLSFFLMESTWKPVKYFYLAVLTLIFLSIIATFGRSTWIATVIIILLGSWLINRRLFGMLTAGFLLFGFVVSFLSPEVYERLLSIFNPSHPNNIGRWNLWRTAWAMFKDHPLLGIGPGFFNDLFPIYKVPGFYDAAGHAHNDYLNFAANSGIIGLTSWLTMWVAWFYYTITEIRKKTLAKSDIQILLGSILAITAILIASFFQCYYTDLENNILWWTLAAFAFMVIQQNKVQVRD